MMGSTLNTELTFSCLTLLASRGLLLCLWKILNFQQRRRSGKMMRRIELLLLQRRSRRWNQATHASWAYGLWRFGPKAGMMIFCDTRNGANVLIQMWIAATGTTSLKIVIELWQWASTPCTKWATVSLPPSDTPTW